MTIDSLRIHSGGLRGCLWNGWEQRGSKAPSPGSRPGSEPGSAEGSPLGSPAGSAEGSLPGSPEGSLEGIFVGQDVGLNVGMELENSYLQLSIDNLTDERTEAFRFSAESPGYRPRNYLQWIPPRSISVQYRHNF